MVQYEGQRQNDTARDFAWEFCYLALYEQQDQDFAQRCMITTCSFVVCAFFILVCLVLLSGGGFCFIFCIYGGRGWCYFLSSVTTGSRDRACLPCVRETRIKQKTGGSTSMPVPCTEECLTGLDQEDTAPYMGRVVRNIEVLYTKHYITTKHTDERCVARCGWVLALCSCGCSK